MSTRGRTTASRTRASVTLPMTRTELSLPETSTLAWYAGMGAMVAFELIEWPIALVVGAAHVIETRSRNRDIQHLAEGAESGA